VDCFIDVRGNSTSAIDNNQADSTVRIFLAKLIMLSVSPLVVIAISYVVWHIIFLVAKVKRIRKA